MKVCQDKALKAKAKEQKKMLLTLDIDGRYSDGYRKMFQCIPSPEVEANAQALEQSIIRMMKGQK